MKNYASNYINRFLFILQESKYKVNGERKDVESFFQELNKQTKKVNKNNGRFFFFGNGASAAFSNHMALDWSKNGGISALSLSDSAMLTALANDYDFEECFLRFLKIHKPTSHDLIITTSSSGNSKNIVKVLEFCKDNGIKTLGLSGLNKKNKTDMIADFSLFVGAKTYGMVECAHQLFHHLMLDKHMEIEEWYKTEPQSMDSINFKL